MEEFLSIAANPPFDQGLPDGAFDNAIARLPELVAKWQSEREEVVMQALRSSPVYAAGKDVPEGVLSHASSVFSCRKCGGTLTCPTLFVHECFLQLIPASTKRVSKKSRKKEEKEEEENTEPPASEGTIPREALDDMVLHTFPNARSWQPGSNLVFDDFGYHHTVVVLDLLGLERTTTGEELRKLNPYLECLCGCFGEKKGNTMSWMNAVSTT
jgi:hypothetical protein